VKSNSVSNLRSSLFAMLATAIVLIAFYVSVDSRDYRVLQNRRALEALRDLNTDGFGEEGAIQAALGYVDKTKAFWHSVTTDGLPVAPYGTIGLHKNSSDEPPTLRELMQWLRMTTSITVYAPDRDSLEVTLAEFEREMTARGFTARRVEFRLHEGTALEVVCTGFYKEVGSPAEILSAPRGCGWSHVIEVGQGEGRPGPVRYLSHSLIRNIPVSGKISVSSSHEARGGARSIYDWIRDEHRLAESVPSSGTSGNGAAAIDVLELIESESHEKTVVEAIEHYDDRLQKSRGALTMVGIAVAASPTLFFVMGPLTLIVLLIVTNGHLAIAKRTMPPQRAEDPGSLLFDASCYGEFYRALHTVTAGFALTLAASTAAKAYPPLLVVVSGLAVAGVLLACYTHVRIRRSFVTQLSMARGVCSLSPRQCFPRRQRRRQGPGGRRSFGRRRY
jgi:hypothetical protein